MGSGGAGRAHMQHAAATTAIGSTSRHPCAEEAVGPMGRRACQLRARFGGGGYVRRAKVQGMQGSPGPAPAPHRPWTHRCVMMASLTTIACIRFVSACPSALERDMAGSLPAPCPSADSVLGPLPSSHATAPHSCVCAGSEGDALIHASSPRSPHTLGRPPCPWWVKTFRSVPDGRAVAPPAQSRAPDAQGGHTQSSVAHTACLQPNLVHLCA